MFGVGQHQGSRLACQQEELVDLGVEFVKFLAGASCAEWVGSGLAGQLAGGAGRPWQGVGGCLEQVRLLPGGTSRLQSVLGG